MKKITFLISGLGGGGAERVTVSLSNYFVSHGYKVNLIVFSRDNDNYSVNENIKINYLPIKKNKLSDVVHKIMAIKSILKQQNPDYVISLGLGYQFLFLGGLLNKYRFILSERNAPEHFYKTELERFIVRYCFKKSYRVVFQTKGAQEYYDKHIQDKSIIIPNPLKSGLPERISGKREKRIVAVNRLSEQKNIPMLFRAFKRFRENFPDYVLEIYGKGEDKQKLIKYAEQLGIIKHIKFMGQVANVHDKILTAGMFVCSSDFEGISNSMLEALAIGLPSICTDCPAGGAKMFIKNGENGILVPVRDADAMSEAMCSVASNLEFAEKLSENSTKIRDELRIDVICNKWEELIG